MTFRAVRGAFLLLFCSGGVSGCVSMLFNSPSVKSESYEIAPMPAPWHKVDPGTADSAYQHDGDRATISLNSVCGQYQDQTLEDLTKSLMLGLDNSHVTGVEKVEAGGFPGLRTTIVGTTDAEPVTIALTVIRSTDCVYDFMLVAHTPTFPAHRQEYVDLVQGFHERPVP